MMHKPKTAIFLLFVLMAATWGARFFMLQKSPYAPGLDGYSYAVQTYSLKHFGKVKDPDASPVLRLLGGLARIIGDPVISNKAGAALLAALLLLPVFLLGRRVTGSPAAGLGMAAFFSFSPSLTCLSIEFLKNLGGLVGLFFFFYFLRGLYCRNGKLPAAAGLLAAAVFTLLAHRSTAVLVLAAAGLALLPLLWKRKGLALLLAGAVTGGFLLLVRLRGGLHFLDLERIADVFAVRDLLPVFSDYLRAVLPGAMTAELTFAALSPFLLLFFRRRLAADPLLRILWVLLFLLALPVWDLSRLDMGFRMLLLAVPLALVLWGCVLFHVLRGLRTGMGGVAVLPVAALLFFSTWVYNPARDPDYRLYERAIAPVDLPADSLLISHQGMNFFYTYKKWKGPRWEGSLCWLPEYEVPVEKLWRLAHGVTFREVATARPDWVKDGRLKESVFPYLLIREDCWNAFLRTQPRERVRSLENWFNPHTVRPAFLRVHRTL